VITIGSRTAFVAFDPVERAGERRNPDALCFAVKAACGGFNGRSDEVWIERGALRAFVAALERLDERREGAAELSAVEPDDLTLRIFALDRAGHLGVEGHLSRWEYLGLEPRRIGTTFAFEIDPGSLPKVIRRFEALMDRKADAAR